MMIVRELYCRMESDESGDLVCGIVVSWLGPGHRFILERHQLDAHFLGSRYSSL